MPSSKKSKRREDPNNEARSGFPQSPLIKKPNRHLKEEEEGDDARFIGEPVPDDEARHHWPHRYMEKSIFSVGTSLEVPSNYDDEFEKWQKEVSEAEAEAEVEVLKHDPTASNDETDRPSTPPEDIQG